MHTRSIRQRLVGGLVALIVLSLLAIPATANHSWGKYHVARPTGITTNAPIPLEVGDNVTGGAWNPPVGPSYLTQAIDDWNKSTRIVLKKVSGGASSDCGPTVGKIEVCNAAYGTNGWLGVANIWINNNHITQGTTKLNDTYFNQARYNTAAWRQMVMCQEIAHDFGLDHQDERFSNRNLGSCMDYTNNPAGGIYNGFDYGLSNEHPNAHDFDQLTTIYSHVETTRTPGGKRNAIGNNPNQWGDVIARDELGRPSHYRKDLSDEEAVFTFVIWAEEPETSGDGGRNDGGRDGGKRDGGKQRQGDRDRHNH